MIIELGNHNKAFDAVDDRPSVTTIEIPEFDAPHREKFNHYGHKVGGVTPDEFRTHRQDALEFNQGVTRLPDHEALLSIVAAWPSFGKGRPAWVKATEAPGLTGKGVAADIEHFLSEYYDVPTLEGYYKGVDTQEAHVRKELEHWTKNGQPGEMRGAAELPPLTATYMQDGRIMNNLNDGGDSLTAMGQMSGTGTGSTSQSITGASGLTSSGLIGHRIYAFTTSGAVWVYGNCTANGTTSVTVDQWYVPATPGGSPGANPGTPWQFVAVDGGMVSSWYAGLATGANSPVNTDHTLATNGNTEYVQASGGLIRKVCPVATDVSSSARTVTLVPVFTANSNDTANLPKTFTVIGFFTSMVVAFGGAGGPMKFETLLNVSATISASGDQLTVTETITGS